MPVSPAAQQAKFIVGPPRRSDGDPKTLSSLRMLWHDDGLVASYAGAGPLG